MSRPPRAVVIGGGITGLAAAYELRRHGATVTVLEASPRVGGKIDTGLFDGVALDAGPDAFLVRVPGAVELCEELGLADVLVSPAARTAYIWWDGELHPLPERSVLGVPTDVAAAAGTGLFSPAGLRRLEADLHTPDLHTPVLHTQLSPPSAGDTVPSQTAPVETVPDETVPDETVPDETVPDETVGALIRRRLGDEAADRLVGPLLSGVNAGSIDQLSLAAGAPQLAVAAAAGGSLMNALAAQRAAAADPDAPVFAATPGGMRTLVEALIGRLGPEAVHTAAPARRLTRAAGGAWRVATPEGDHEAELVVVAAPAPAAAELLAPAAPGAAALLAGVDYASVTLVSLAYPDEALTRPLDASGFLVPERAGLLLTACSWASTKWAHLARPGRVLLRASVGRFGDERQLALRDDELVAWLQRDLAATMGLRSEPRAVRVSRWPRSLPQYRPGHLERADAIDAACAAEAPGVAAAGAALRGLGLPACIRQGRAAARALLR